MILQYYEINKSMIIMHISSIIEVIVIKDLYKFGVFVREIKKLEALVPQLKFCLKHIIVIERLL